MSGDRAALRAATMKARHEAEAYAALHAELVADGEADAGDPPPEPEQIRRLLTTGRDPVAVLGMLHTALPDPPAPPRDGVTSVALSVLRRAEALVRPNLGTEHVVLMLQCTPPPLPAAVLVIAVGLDARGVKVPHIADGDPPVRMLLGEDLHQLWTLTPELKHPLAPLVRWWCKRPQPLDRRHLITPAILRGDEPRPLVRAPAVVDLCMLSPVEAVLVDDIPLASAAPAMQAYRRRPMRRPPNQGELRFAGPRSVGHVPVVNPIIAAVASLPLTGDERNLIRADVIRLAELAYALTGAATVPDDAGARFIAGGAVTDATLRRWWNACAVFGTALMTINERTGEWLDLGIATHTPDLGVVELSPPAWWHGKGKFVRWRLSGGLWRPALSDGKRGAGGTAERRSALHRTVAGLESRLAYTPAAGRGKHGRIPSAHRPVRPGRAGQQVFVPWREVLTLAGEHVPPDAGAKSKDGRRYGRRVVALVETGYHVPVTGGAAPAGDTVEIVKQVRGGRGREAGLVIRASALFCEAVLRSQRRSNWERIPAVRVLGEN